MSTAKAAVVNANEISWDSLFPGDGLEDSCHRRRNQLETCIKKQKKSEQKTLFHFSVVNLETNVTLWEIFRKILVRTSTAHRWRSSKKNLAHSTRKNKCSHLEPHFRTWATKSRCLEDTISFSTSPICTKRMLGREMAVRHVWDIF